MLIVKEFRLAEVKKYDEKFATGTYIENLVICTIRASWRYVVPSAFFFKVIGEALQCRIIREHY